MEKKLSVIDELIDYIENNAEIAIPIDEFFKEKDGLKTSLTKKEYGLVLIKYLVKELKGKDFKEKHKQEIIEAYNVGYDRAMTKYGICENDREFRTAEQYFNNTFNQLNK